jgi:hypothetical protein
MGREDRIVRFNHCSGNLGRRIDSKSEFGFFTVIN